MKHFPYTNPMQVKKTFFLHSDKPHLLGLKEHLLEMEGGEKKSVGIRFLPVTAPMSQEILVFINDDDKNLECIQFQVTYR